MRLQTTGIATALLLAACASETTTRDYRTRHLDDSDKDGLLEEKDPSEDGYIIMPNPGDCPLMEWTEIHTVVVDADGNVVSETWEVCTQCFDEAQNPVGEKVCYEEPPFPLDLICEEYDGGDPNLTCYRCVTPAGELWIDDCYQKPIECTTDADCPEGQVCYVWDHGYDEDGDGMRDAPNVSVTGWCGYPNPCVYVGTLESDPTGESCWVCTDPATGADLGSWCDFHRCGADGSCVNPWEICEPESGYCVWDDPCDPVPSLPNDPTGEDCYQCTDPNTGEDWGGWCNIHHCASDADCAEYGQICGDGGLCEWVDRCSEDPSLPGDPNDMGC